MKLVLQFSIILLLSFIGELLSSIIPLPIPGSIYGLVIMLILLCTGVLKTKHVKAVSDFLIEIMPVMFIPVTVGIMDTFSTLKSLLPEILILSTLGTMIVMAVSGYFTQLIMRKSDKKRRKMK